MNKIVFVTDFLASEIQGGAELSLDAIVQAAPKDMQVGVIKTELLTPDMLSDKSIHWVFGNYTRIPRVTLDFWLRTSDQMSYSIIEFDYKYCILRNEIVHNYQTFMHTKSFSFCNCMTQEIGLITEKLFYNAQKLFFMSEEQKKLIYSRMPRLVEKQNNHFIQWSTWTPEHLQKLDDLHTERAANGFGPMYLIQGSENWLKGTENAIKFAESQTKLYKVAPHMKYEDFLTEMSKCQGFIFHPNAWDTCPRVVVEAKLIGLEVYVNDKVQIKDDPIYNQDRQTLLEYLHKSPQNFWTNIR